MRLHVVAVVALGSLSMLSGCAGQRRAHIMTQLESDLGLLDQRVTQLERASLTGGASGTAWPTEAASPAPPAESAVAVQHQPAALRRAISAKPVKKDIQRALQNAGFYKGALDGKIGPKTREAVRQFQQVNGLKVDGVVGKETWSRLSAYLDMNASAPESGAAEPK